MGFWGHSKSQVKELHVSEARHSRLQGGSLVGGGGGVKIQEHRFEDSKQLPWAFVAAGVRALVGRRLAVPNRAGTSVPENSRQQCECGSWTAAC